MRLVLDVKTLNAGITTVIKSLSSRPALPILEGIYLCATQEGLLLRCSDLSLQIECVIPATVGGRRHRGAGPAIFRNGPKISG